MNSRASINSGGACVYCVVVGATTVGAVDASAVTWAVVVAVTRPFWVKMVWRAMEWVRRFRTSASVSPKQRTGCPRFRNAVRTSCGRVGTCFNRSGEADNFFTSKSNSNA
eukprot:scaffold47833_cov57-Attheya_sp.AAC.2